MQIMYKTSACVVYFLQAIMSMNRKELIHRTMQYILDLMDVNVTNTCECLAEDVYWIGLHEGQIFHSRKEVYQKLGEFSQPMHGQISGITSTATELAPSALSIMTEFRLLFSQPSNVSSAIIIRIHVIWAMRNGNPRIVFHQSSIAEPINTSSQMFSFQMDTTTLDRFPFKDERVLIRGLNDYYFYYPISSISWMESVDRSTHTMVHLFNKNIISIDRLRSFDANYGSSFLRVSRSIMVNPFYIRQLTRYQLLMDNGDIIPVPEKRYMTIKKELADWSSSSIKR
jgi:hypothetical protein